MTGNPPAWVAENDDYVHTDEDAPDASVESTPARQLPVHASLSDLKGRPDTRRENSIGARWLSLADRPDLLSQSPPKQKWLLTQCEQGREVGVFPRGKTGLLVGAGGVSKTMCVTQLAVAIAAGGFLFETFRVAEAGHVVLALAEEELAECHRRLWRVCNALELSPEKRADLAMRLHVLPLHGLAVALLQSPAANVHEPTGVLAELTKCMEARSVDWSAVLMDPLARWSGAGAERDNEAATRLVQLVEVLTEQRGNPSVLLAHHSSQASIVAGNSAPRGVTALHDGFRWVANMDVVKAKDSQRAVRLHNSKSNYSPEFGDLLLVRNSEPGVEGTLRLATTLETEKFGVTDAGRAKAREDKTRGAFEADCERVLEHLPIGPAHMTSGALDGALRAAGKALGDKTLKRILEHLASPAGGQVVTDLSNGAQSKPRQWARIGSDP